MSRRISPGGTLVGALDFSYRSQRNGVLSYPTHTPMALEAVAGRTARKRSSRRRNLRRTRVAVALQVAVAQIHPTTRTCARR
jgi:hypothetical protein